MRTRSQIKGEELSTAEKQKTPFKYSNIHANADLSDNYLIGTFQNHIQQLEFDSQLLKDKIDSLILQNQKLKCIIREDVQDYQFIIKNLQLQKQDEIRQRSDLYNRELNNWTLSNEQNLINFTKKQTQLIKTVEQERIKNQTILKQLEDKKRIIDQFQDKTIQLHSKFLDLQQFNKKNLKSIADLSHSKDTLIIQLENQKMKNKNSQVELERQIHLLRNNLDKSKLESSKQIQKLQQQNKSIKLYNHREQKNLQDKLRRQQQQHSLDINKLSQTHRQSLLQLQLKSHKQKQGIQHLINQMNKQIQKILQDNKDLIKQNDKQKRRIIQLTYQVQQSKRDRQKYIQTVSKVEDINRVIAKQVSQAQEQIKYNQSLNRKLNGQVKQSQLLNQKHCDHISYLQAEINKIKNRNIDLQQDKQMLKREKNNLYQECLDLNNLVSQSKQSNYRSLKQIQNVQKDLSSMKQMLLCSSQQLNNCRMDILRLKQQQQKLRIQKSQLMLIINQKDIQAMNWRESYLTLKQAF